MRVRCPPTPNPQKTQPLSQLIFPSIMVRWGRSKYPSCAHARLEEAWAIWTKDLLILGVVVPGEASETMIKLCLWPSMVLLHTLAIGVMNANVGQNVTPHKPSLGLFLYHFYIQWACGIMIQFTTTKTTNKHHHHGDGAACPSSGMDSMNPHRPGNGWPCAFIFWGCSWRV